MKKLFTLLCASMLAISAFAINEDGTYDPIKDFSHWSISINGGLSQFDGDCFQRYNQLLSSSYIMWTAGIDVEYTFNPVWGLIINFQYMPYQGHTNKDYGERYFRGNMYNLHFLGSINLLNIFGQFRRDARWAWYVNGGMGCTFYDVKSNYEDGYKKRGDEKKKGETQMKNARCLTFPVGSQVEFNINKWLAVGINAYYRFQSKDNFENEDYTKGTMNDGEFYATLNFRVKFATKDREGGHMRNISMFDYQQKRSGEAGYMADLDSLKKRVKALEDTVNNNILPRLAALEEQHATEPDEDGDGVPDFRDREPGTPAGSFVNYWGESIPAEVLQGGKGCCDEVKQIAEQLGLGIDYEASVYFDFDKYYLTKVAKENIENAYKKLMADPDLKVQLRGYCDFPGKKDYNIWLSNKRVDTVEKALLDKGISQDRITKTGKGKLPNPPMREYKNRRCDFYFYK